MKYYELDDLFKLLLKVENGLAAKGMHEGDTPHLCQHPSAAMQELHEALARGEFRSARELIKREARNANE